MEEQLFWSIIHQFKSENGILVDSEPCLNLLASYDYETILAFEVTLREKTRLLHNCKTISVSTIFHGEGIELTYQDFLCWLVAKGESFYKKFIEDPNSVADDILFTFEHDSLSMEELAYLADSAYEMKFGGSFEDDEAPRMQVSDPYRIDKDSKELDCLLDDATLEKNFPKLWKGYWEIWSRRTGE
jgi:hypothetical protein